MSEKNINPTLAGQCILTLRLSTEGFTFSVYHPGKKEILYSKHVPVNTRRSMAANVKSFLADTPELNLPYQEVNILLHTLRYTTVPSELFEDDHMELLFYQNLPKQNNEIVLCNMLGKCDAIVLFGIDKLTHILLSEHFPRVRFFATVSPLLEYFTGASLPADVSQTYVCLHAESMDVVCLKKGELRLANTFAVNSLNDRAYYLLNIWKQLGLDREEDELRLTGLTKEAQNELITFLRQFIRKIYIIQPQVEGKTLSGETEHLPFDIQSLLSCE